MNSDRSVRVNYLRNAAQRVGLTLDVGKGYYAFVKPSSHNAFYARSLREAEAFASGTDFVHFGGVNPDDLPFE